MKQHPPLGTYNYGTIGQPGYSLDLNQLHHIQDFQESDNFDILIGVGDTELDYFQINNLNKTFIQSMVANDLTE